MIEIGKVFLIPEDKIEPFYAKMKVDGWDLRPDGCVMDSKIGVIGYYQGHELYIAERSKKFMNYLSKLEL